MQNLAVPAAASTDDGVICEKHYEESYPEVKPTCIKSGWTGGSYCKICGYVMTPRTEVHANLKDVTVHVAIMAVEQSDPNCTEPGLSAYTYCSACKTYLTSPEEIKANVAEAAAQAADAVAKKAEEE